MTINLRIKNKLGLIAGMGELPKAVASEARQQGFKVIGIALEPIADKSFSSYVDEIRWVNIGKFGRLIDILKKHDVKHVLMAGKVSKSLLYKSKIMPDLRAMKLLFSLKDRSDDSIMLAITKELQKEGITLIEITPFITELLTPEGILTGGHLAENDWKDIKFGWKIAKEIGRLDIGQTVVVKNQAVMAVEAIEGTDECIRRGGKLADKGAIVVKVSKPNQDMRFDVPVVGSKTLKAMAEVSARVLCIESQKCLILNKDNIIEEAKKSAISIVGYSG